MSRRPLTVRQIAIESGLDFDKALVTLWDNGFDDVLDIDDRISANRVARAQSALGIATLREMRSPVYWERKLGLDRSELQARLREIGVSLPKQARVLPKGALAKLKRIDGQAAWSPLTLPKESLAEVEAEGIPDEPGFVWRSVGRNLRHDNLSPEEILQIHEALEKEFASTADPIQPPGVRDLGLLESAVFRAETSLGGEDKYPTAEMAAAALMHSIVHNHAFFNGNKRTALVSLLVVLDRNGVLLTCNESDLFRFVLRVAQHRLVPTAWQQLADREVLEAADWICENSRPLERGDRLLKWRQLRQVLSKWGCEFEGPLPGNKIKITRREQRSRGFLGRTRPRKLVITTWYGGEGKDVAPVQIKKIRQTLELDDEHGYDAGYFYGNDPQEPDEFISQHRGLLRRLAKL